MTQPEYTSEAEFLGNNPNFRWVLFSDPDYSQALGSVAPDALAERILRDGVHDYVWTGEDE